MSTVRGQITTRQLQWIITTVTMMWERYYWRQDELIPVGGKECRCKQVDNNIRCNLYSTRGFVWEKWYKTKSVQTNDIRDPTKNKSQAAGGMMVVWKGHSYFWLATTAQPCWLTETSLFNIIICASHPRHRRIDMHSRRWMMYFSLD